MVPSAAHALTRVATRQALCLVLYAVSAWSCAALVLVTSCNCI